MNYELSTTMAWLLGALFIWEAVWKGLALWRAARNGQMAWYVAILVLNTAGILPIVYLLIIGKKEEKKVN